MFNRISRKQKKEGNKPKKEVNIDNCFAIDTQQKFPQKNKKLLETRCFGWNDPCDTRIKKKHKLNLCSNKIKTSRMTTAICKQKN